MTYKIIKYNYCMFSYKKNGVIDFFLLKLEHFLHYNFYTYVTLLTPLVDGTQNTHLIGLELVNNLIFSTAWRIWTNLHTNVPIFVRMPILGKCVSLLPLPAGSTSNLVPAQHSPVLHVLPCTLWIVNLIHLPDWYWRRLYWWGRIWTPGKRTPV